MKRDPRREYPAHLRFIRTLPCCVCLNNIETEAAHIRMSFAPLLKVNAGVGAKAHDFWVVPLCNSHHTLQHNIGNEDAFWNDPEVDINPLLLALALYAHSGDSEHAERIVANARRLPKFH